MADTPIETRLARLETLPDSLERIERGLDRVSERLDNLHRLEQQQAHHSASIERAFQGLEKLAQQVDKAVSGLGARVSELEKTAAEKLGWARGWLSMASTVLGLAQLVVMAVGGYLFSHLASLEVALGERSKAIALLEQRLVVIERSAGDMKGTRP